MTIKRTWPALVGILALVLSFWLPMSSPANGAPAAVPTPITQSAFNARASVVEFWPAGDTIAADERACVDSTGFSVLDLHYILDQTTTNTTTLTLEYSNITSGYADTLIYPDGVAVVSANTSDTADMKQFHVFGRRTCIIADVANTNSLGIAVVGELK
jgi:hypothetical protein